MKVSLSDFSILSSLSCTTRNFGSCAFAMRFWKAMKLSSFLTAFEGGGVCAAVIEFIESVATHSKGHTVTDLNSICGSVESFPLYHCDVTVSITRSHQRRAG